MPVQLHRTDCTKQKRTGSLVQLPV